MLKSQIELAIKEVKWAEERLKETCNSGRNSAITELMEAEERLNNLLIIKSKKDNI